MRTSKKAQHLAIAMALALNTLLPGAFALAEAGSISVDPIKDTITTDPGATIETTITVTNESEDAKNLSIEFAEFTVDEAGVPSEVSTPSDDAAYEWFAVTETSYEVAADGNVEIPLTITIPDDATEKGYYVMGKLSIATTDELAAANETKQEIQSLYSIVVGSPEAIITIDSITATDDMIILTVNNPSTVHVPVSGKIDLTYDDEIAETYSVESVNVFPGKTRNIGISIDELDRDDYIIEASLAYGADNTIVTKEQPLSTASATVSADDLTQTATVQNTATVVSDTKLDTTDIVIYSLLGLGILLTFAGIIMTLTKKK